MIKNGYLVFAILQIILILVIIYGIYAHIDSLFMDSINPVDKFVIYASLISLPPLLISSAIATIKWLILNKYTNSYDLQATMKCC